MKLIFCAILGFVLLVSSQNCGCNNECCSQYGYCGTTADYCDTQNGCKEGCWGNGGGNNNGGNNGGNKTSLTPNGKKAGISAGDSYPWLQSHIGWWYDWSPTPSKPGNPIAVPMLWGAGTADDTDRQRLAAFRNIKDTTPKYVLGFEEPDCPAGSGSAGMDVNTAASLWNELIAPMGKRGTLMLSPSMCKQYDEDWLTPFGQKINFNWDITAIHVNKNNMDGVRKDIDHYWNTYKKPIWVTEFACVNDQNGFTPSEDQNEINNYINQIVDLFESDSRIYGYAYSNGYGLGSKWPMVQNGQLTESGRTYLAAVSKYHK